MDKPLIARQFSKSLFSYNSEAKVQKEVAAKLSELIFENSENKLGKVFEIGCGTGLLTEYLMKNFFIDELILNDLTQGADFFANDLFERYPKPKMSFTAEDAEETRFPQECDLICSSSTIQWFHDLPSFFNKASKSLLNNGILALSSFGLNNFKEIRSLGFSGLEYHTVEDLLAMVANDYEVIHQSEKEIKLLFDSPLEVLQHFKKTGVNGLSRHTWTKTKLEEFSQNYKEKFTEKGQVHLTYHPIYLILKAKKD